MNHRWKDNTCIHCGLTRERKTQKLLMAITNNPPFNHYRYEVKWWYGEYLGYNRPDCKQLNKQSKEEQQ